MITWCLCFLEICSAIPTTLHFRILYLHKLAEKMSQAEQMYSMDMHREKQTHRMIKNTSTVQALKLQSPTNWLTVTCRFWSTVQSISSTHPCHVSSESVTSITAVCSITSKRGAGKNDHSICNIRRVTTVHNYIREVFTAWVYTIILQDTPKCHVGRNGKRNQQKLHIDNHDSGYLGMAVQLYV